MGLAVVGTALVLAGPIPATAVAGQTRAASADPVSVMTYTAKERQESLAYWTPARMKAVGKSVDLGPTGPKAKPWQGTAMKTVGRLFFVNANGADTWCTATAVKSANRCFPEGGGLAHDLTRMCQAPPIASDVNGRLASGASRRRFAHRVRWDVRRCR
ncbi:hypothetical protein [Streptomyces sp. NRRL S-1813]|uniref:hypothetical protein n=1 Tax=Streptomyces sp. NRRL S-1813 TaxID=1463888 RepID=UPI000AC94CA9|nr:hypothetical protein [Streptomyces sp. NRRL S-1813]